MTRVFVLYRGQPYFDPVDASSLVFNLRPQSYPTDTKSL